MAKPTMAERLALGVNAGQEKEATISAEAKDRRARAEAAARQIVADQSAVSNPTPPTNMPEMARAFGFARSEEMVDIPLESIQDNPYNPRKFYDMGGIQSLASAIAAEGQGVPLVVAVVEGTGDRVLLIDGKRRLLALQILKRPTASAIVRTIKSEKELYFLGRSLNVERSAQTALDDALSWKELLDKGVVPTMSALAEQLGVDLSTVSATLGLASMPLELLTAMSKNPRTSGIAAAREIAGFHGKRGAGEAMTLIEMIIEKEMSVRQIKDYVREEPARVAPERSTRERYLQRTKYQVGGKDVGELKTYGTGKIELALVLPDEIQRDRVFERISQLLAEEVDK